MQTATDNNGSCGSIHLHRSIHLCFKDVPTIFNKQHTATNQREGGKGGREGGRSSGGEQTSLKYMDVEKYVASCALIEVEKDEIAHQGSSA